jgi:F-type H+-transporting ATPase subunit delta
MAELATLARPYANAVFGIAKQSATLDGWSRALEFLAVATADDQMTLLLQAPDIAEQQKALRLIEICGDELNEQMKKFVQVLAINKRLPLIGSIQEQFEELRALELQSLDVQVTSAFPLSDGEGQRLASALARKFEKEVHLTSEVDQSLIGGVVIRAGDIVIDGSVRGKLEKLSESIQRT